MTSTPRTIVAAPDKFKGTASARVIAEAIAAAATEFGASTTLRPMADGGEGTLDVLGGPNRTSTVTNPLGDSVDAPWRLARGTAVIEMAAASGLTILGGAEGNDAIAASTSGTGELISLAAEAGASRVIVGVGGSATTDGGFGALRAMYPLARFRGIEIVVACDVRTTFLDAPAVFAPQKGASSAQVKLLRRRLERLAQVYETEHGVDVIDLPRSGAAGGLAGGLAAIGAQLVDGFDLVAEEVELYEAIESADLVITGEGFIDAASFDGKVVGGVADYARAAGVPVLAVAGEVFDDARSRLDAISLADRFGREQAMRDPAGCVTTAVREWLSVN